MNVAARVCRSPDSWLWTDYSQISLMHSPTPPKCSTRAIMALINNLGIVYYQYCSSSAMPVAVCNSLVSAFKCALLLRLGSWQCCGNSSADPEILYARMSGT
jgi:hypothetical protein